jgi:hypothetical protein
LRAVAVAQAFEQVAAGLLLAAWRRDLGQPGQDAGAEGVDERSGDLNQIATAARLFRTRPVRKRRIDPGAWLIGKPGDSPRNARCVK